MSNQQDNQRVGGSFGRTADPYRSNGGPDGGPANEHITTVIKEDGQSAFKPEVVGYFHPDLPSTYSKHNIVYSGKETIYRGVHAFVDRLNDMLVVYGAPVIRTNLVKCLRGRASAWYTT